MAQAFRMMASGAMTAPNMLYFLRMDVQELPQDWIDLAIQFEATPQRLREQTVVEFCEEHDVPRSTYYSAMSRTENKKRILELTLNKAKDEAPEVLDVLVQKAKDGDMRAMDIYIDSILKLAKNLDLKSDGKPLVFIPAELADKNGIPLQDAA